MPFAFQQTTGRVPSLLEERYGRDERDSIGMNLSGGFGLHTYSYCALHSCNAHLGELGAANNVPCFT